MPIPTTVVQMYVTRTELSLADLDLRSAYTSSSNPPTGLFVDRPEELIDVGDSIEIQSFTKSPVIPGGALRHSIPDLSEMNLVVRNLANDQATLSSQAAAVRAAFKQYSFEIHIVLDAVDHGFLCYKASRIHAGFNRLAIRGGSQPIQITCMRSPIPTDGPWG